MGFLLSPSSASYFIFSSLQTQTQPQLPQLSQLPFFFLASIFIISISKIENLICLFLLWYGISFFRWLLSSYLYRRLSLSVVASVSKAGSWESLCFLDSRIFFDALEITGEKTTRPYIRRGVYRVGDSCPLDMDGVGPFPMKAPKSYKRAPMSPWTLKRL